MNLEWREEYNVGVDYIDNAHKQIFQIIYKVSEILADKDEERKKLACKSCIKYLTKYALTHFEQEEAYQRSIDFPAAQTHAQLHNNFKNVALPQMSKMLEEENYSDKAIKSFTTLFCGWLTNHILIEDLAMTDKVSSKWHHEDYSIDVISRLSSEFGLFINDLFGLKIELFNTHYEGKDLEPDMFMQEIAYDTSKGKYKVLFKCSRSFVRYTINRITNNICDDLDEAAVSAFQGFATSWSDATIDIVTEYANRKTIDSRLIDDFSYKSMFDGTFPSPSLVWKAEEFLMAICVKRMEA